MNNTNHVLKVAVNTIFKNGNKVLLFRRKNTGWEDGKYGLPGGHLEKEETVLQACVREIKEETDLDVSEKDLEFVHASQKRTNFDYIDMFFIVKKWNGEPKLTEEDKSDDILWADLDNLPSNILDFNKSAFEKIKENKYFSQFDL